MLMRAVFSTFSTTLTANLVLRVSNVQISKFQTSEGLPLPTLTPDDPLKLELSPPIS